MMMISSRRSMNAEEQLKDHHIILSMRISSSSSWRKKMV